MNKMNETDLPVTQLASVTLKYRDIDDLIIQLGNIKKMENVGNYTEIQLEKDFAWLYRQEAQGDE